MADTWGMAPMTALILGIGLVFLAVGFALGWYSNKTYASHGDVKSTKAKIPGYRKSRHRNGFITALLAFAIGVVIVGFMHPHH
jgi:MFS family permease